MRVAHAAPTNEYIGIKTRLSDMFITTPNPLTKMQIDCLSAALIAVLQIVDGIMKAILNIRAGRTADEGAYSEP